MSVSGMECIATQSSWAHKAFSAVLSLCCSEEAATSPSRRNQLPKLVPEHPRVLHFGGSDFGRGYIMRVMHDAGCEMVLADAAPSLVYPLSEDKKYLVRRVGAEGEKKSEVLLADVIFMHSDQAIEEICRADLITTTVGVDDLSTLVETLVKGLRKRRALSIAQAKNRVSGEIQDRVLNILVCENSVTARNDLYRALCDASACCAGLNEWLEENVGVVDTVTDCIVPWRELQENTEPFEVVTEDYGEFYIGAQDVLDLTGFHIDGIKVTSKLSAQADRQLMTVQAGHATAAYYGHLLGHKEIGAALEQQAVVDVVRGVMLETATLLCRRHGFQAHEHADFIDETIRRFQNPLLHDSIARIAMRPLRKLEQGACFTRSLHFACSAGAKIRYLALATAACLLYDTKDEVECGVIQTKMQKEGVRQAIQSFTGLTNKKCLQAIVSALRSLEVQAVERRKAASTSSTFVDTAYSAMIAAHS